jgi:uncharacterized iron-regulated membrane protein
MGLSSGIVIFVVCLSGTIYTFRSEIERWVEPDKYYAHNTSGLSMLPADTLIARMEALYEGKVTTVVVPADKTMNWQIGVKRQSALKKETKKGEAAPSRPKSYFINPYTGEIAGEQGGSTSEFFTTTMKLHRWLLMEESTGRIIVGIATIIMALMLLSGLVLWFPAQIRYIRQGLRIKWSANWKRVNHDLHNVLGFYAFLVLLIMTLTGLCWSFEWYRNGLSGALGAKVFKGRGEKPLMSDEKASANGSVSISVLLAEMKKIYPYDGTSRVSIPEDGNAAVTITKSATGFFAVAGSDKAQFDRFTGEPIKIESFSDKPLNSQIADSIKLIHTGEIFGTASKIIYFLACLIATSLPITGTFIWLNKMKKKKKPVKMQVFTKKEFA